MTVLETAAMPDGTGIQLEDRSDDYPTLHTYCDTVGAYPVATQSLQGPIWVYPKRGKTFRVTLTFQNETEARSAYESLQAGTKRLSDFADNFWWKHHVPCVK